jgi:nucleoside-diphosphate-sugar epimerase
MAAAKIITVTGGNGFVGRLLQGGLRERGYRVDVFDRRKGRLVDLLQGRYFGTWNGRPAYVSAILLRRGMRALEESLASVGVIRPAADDIHDPAGRLVERFRGSYAVIHLAALPHQHVRGMTEADYRRINYDASVNVFEAAREAGVPKFIFASSYQIYGIGNGGWPDQFPIPETNYLPTMAEGQTAYGFLKGEFERYLAQRCAGGGTQAISLRLEFPGTRSGYDWNFYISTSIENTNAGFACALEADPTRGFDAFHLADRTVDKSTVDIQEFVRKRYPRVPNYTTGNECLLSTEKARSLLGYDPREGGTYYTLPVA